MRRIARRYVQRENSDHTLQPTALVHEAYLRLVDAKIAQWQDRAHFFAVCAQMMRRILVSAARKRATEKRGGGGLLVELNESIDGAPMRDDPNVCDALDCKPASQRVAQPRNRPSQWM